MYLLEKALESYIRGSIPQLEALPKIEPGKPLFVLERVRLKSRDGSLNKIVYILGAHRVLKCYIKGSIEIVEPKINFVYLEDSRANQDSSNQLEIKLADPADIVRYERIESYPNRTILFPHGSGKWAVSPPGGLEISLIGDLETE